MSVAVSFASELKTVETLEINAGHQADGKVVTSKLTTALSNQGAASTPPCTIRAGADVALDAGSGTLDLTALVGTNGVAVDGSGLRVQFAKFLNPSTNANPITIAIGASDGYDGFGDAFGVTLAPGAEILLRTMDAGSNIGATKKTLDLTGTGTQALSYEIVMG